MDSQETSMELADRVHPLIWAEKQTQGYVDLYQYKGTDEESANQSIYKLQLIVRNAFSKFHSCLLGNNPVSAIAHVPSTKGKIPHPFSQIISGIAPNFPQLIPILIKEVNVSNAKKSPDIWAVDTAGFEDTHVLLMDDLWTTGHSAQSLASALKREGINEVTIVPIARVLEPSWHDNKSFWNTHGKKPFNPNLCPVHGSHCP